jgi:hypothetical protein
MPNDRPQAADRPEAPSVATRAVLFTATGLMASLGIALVVLHFFYRTQIHQELFVPPTPFAKPQLQTNDVKDLAKLQAEQRGRLGGYRWVDRDNGVIAIPIEEAMKRIVARGANAYAPIPAIAPAPQSGGGKQQ